MQKTKTKTKTKTKAKAKAKARPINEGKESGKQIKYTQRIYDVSKMIDIGTLVSNISHELRNMAAVISGYSDYLSDAINENSLTSNDPNVKKSISAISETTRRILSTIDDLYLFSSRPLKDDELERINIGELVEKLITFHSKKFNDVVVKHECKLDDKHNNVLCKQFQIKRAIFHLLKNAYESFDRNIKNDTNIINITTKVDGGHVKISISDTGTGIDKSIAPKIFNPFFTTKQKNAHLGLGLSISHDLITKNAGTLIYDQNEKLTTFRLTFPLVEKEME